MSDKKSSIFNAGRDLFLQKGFKDVNVSDITKQAGFSVGTFYNYYVSKEELFIEIYYRENEMAKKAIIDDINIDDDPLNIAMSFISQIMSTLKSNLILKEWYNKGVLADLEREYRNKEDKRDCFVYAFFRKLLEKWRAEGKVRNDIDDSQIFALVDSLIFLDTHKAEITMEPSVMKLLVEFIFKGITNLNKE